MKKKTWSPEKLTMAEKLCTNICKGFFGAIQGKKSQFEKKKRSRDCTSGVFFLSLSLVFFRGDEIGELTSPRKKKKLNRSPPPQERTPARWGWPRRSDLRHSCGTIIHQRRTVRSPSSGAQNADISADCGGKVSLLFSRLLSQCSRPLAWAHSRKKSFFFFLVFLCPPSDS